MEPKELWSLAVLVLVWYVANVGFNVGMKRSHALMPDVLVLTAFQFGAGAIAYGGAWLTGHAKLPDARWAVPLGCSAVLLLGGTLFTTTYATVRVSKGSYLERLVAKNGFRAPMRDAHAARLLLKLSESA